MFLTKKKHPLTNKQTEIVKLCQNILLLDNSYKSRIQDKLSYVSRHLNLFTEQIKPDSLRSRLFYIIAGGIGRGVLDELPNGQ